MPVVKGQAKPQDGLRLRADARLGAQRILNAADGIFAQHGVQAPLDLVIAAAGVGRTTFYRRFADREALLAALLDRALDELEEVVASHGDAADSVLRTFDFMLERMTYRLTLVSYWAAVDADHPVNLRTAERMIRIFTAPVARGIEAGLCRADLTVEDITLYGRMLGAAMQGCSPEVRRQAGARAASLLFTGFAPPSGNKPNVNRKFESPRQAER
jgi:AcrR family transcriptional regulator